MLRRISPEVTRRAAAALVILFATVGRAAAENPTPYPGTVVTPTKHSYAELVVRLDTAVRAQKMGLVTRASATRGAASLGKTIPGNMVVGVYRPDFAIRMLDASVAAGIEAPLRFYITENADGSATLTWRRPSAVFAPYEVPALDEMARELDLIFAAIARDASGE